MKKILLATLICVVASLSSFAQSGDMMADTHNIYAGLTHTYTITGTDTFEWEVFTDAGCTTPGSEGVNTFNYTTARNTTSVGIKWNEPLAPATSATYYLRIKQTDGDGCINYKTLTVVVTSVSNMSFAFADPGSTSCAVNISGSDVMFNINLVGDHLVHETGKVAQVEYAIGTGGKKWLDIDLGATPADIGAGAYTITIPAAELMSADAEVSEDFVINVYQLKDGNEATKDFTGSPVSHTWTADPLPTVNDIQF